MDRLINNEKTIISFSPKSVKIKLHDTSHALTQQITLFPIPRLIFSDPVFKIESATVSNWPVVWWFNAGIWPLLKISAYLFCPLDIRHVTLQGLNVSYQYVFTFCVFCCCVQAFNPDNEYHFKNRMKACQRNWAEVFGEEANMFAVSPCNTYQKVRPNSRVWTL